MAACSYWRQSIKPRTAASPSPRPAERWSANPACAPAWPCRCTARSQCGSHRPGTNRAIAACRHLRGSCGCAL